jgi:hypothetical protein
MLSSGTEILIAAVHLPSKLHISDVAQDFACVEVSREITEAERRVGHDRTLVVGDLNMDPYQPGLIAAQGLHAVMDRRVAARGQRTIRGRSYPFFYNPMWSLMGDKDGRPSGSYFYPKSGDVSYFWHTFDQLLLRPSMIDKLEHESLCIITTDGQETLMDESGRPDSRNGSDHFPIAFRILD